MKKFIKKTGAERECRGIVIILKGGILPFKFVSILVVSRYGSYRNWVTCWCYVWYIYIYIKLLRLWPVAHDNNCCSLIVPNWCFCQLRYHLYDSSHNNYWLYDMKYLERHWEPCIWWYWSFLVLIKTHAKKAVSIMSHVQRAALYFIYKTKNAEN